MGSFSTRTLVLPYRVVVEVLWISDTSTVLTVPSILLLLLSYYLRSIPLVQVNFSKGSHPVSFQVVSLYSTVYFVPLGEAGEFYLKVFSRFLNVSYIDLNIITVFRYFF